MTTRPLFTTPLGRGRSDQGRKLNCKLLLEVFGGCSVGCSGPPPFPELGGGLEPGTRRWGLPLRKRGGTSLLDSILACLEAQQRYFSYRAILVAIVSQNSSVLVFMGYRTIIARYVAKWGIAQMCLCETKYQGGYRTILGER